MISGLLGNAGTDVFEDSGRAGIVGKPGTGNASSGDSLDLGIVGKLPAGTAGKFGSVGGADFKSGIGNTSPIGKDGTGNVGVLGAGVGVG